MCRLLGFATAGSNTNLNGVLGMQNVRDFRNLSEIHNDGWGAALITVPDESPYRRDGGAPTPETGTAIYKNTIAARHDPIFDELANTPARGGLWHLRLASSNLPLILENQQPFYANGLSFIHNGDISDYPKSSYNCMIQSQDQFIALCAAGREVTSKRIVEIYDQYGRGEQARDYRVLRYRALGGNDDAQPKGVVVASSGFDQRAEDGWTRLENDQMIVASNRTGEFRVRSI